MAIAVGLLKENLFGFYPDQWDVVNYRRIGDEVAPTAFEGDWNIKINDHNAGKLSVAAGPEVVWGDTISYYAKYSYRMGLWSPTLLFKDEGIEWADAGDRIVAAALTTKYYGLFRVPIEGGILFQPYKVNHTYTTTTPTSISSGYGTSGYIIEQKQTDYADAFGFMVKANTDLVPYINKTSFAYTYEGRIAGNVNRFDLGLEKRLMPNYTLYWDNMYQDPVENAEALILEGTSANAPGQPIAQPRGRDDPFWVNTQNRQAFISTFTFMFDPAQTGWIFKYNPNVVELWNLNLNKITPFSFVFNYKLSYYPGLTDLEFYKNANNTFLWPGDYDPTLTFRYPSTVVTGDWAMKRPIQMVTLLGEWSLTTKGLLVAIVKFGEDIAMNPLAYTTYTWRLTPLTRMFNPSVTYVQYPWSATIEYGDHVWSPEYFYMDEGVKIDHLYKVSVKYNLTKNHEFELQYVGARQDGNDYFVNNMSPYDEFRFTYKAHFGTRFTLIPSSSEAKKEEKPLGNTEELNNLIEESPKVTPKQNNSEDLDNLLQETTPVKKQNNTSLTNKQPNVNVPKNNQPIKTKNTSVTNKGLKNDSDLDNLLK